MAALLRIVKINIAKLKQAYEQQQSDSKTIRREARVCKKARK